MALLAEYALTPDVFDVTSYSSAEVCGLHLQLLKEVLLQEGLVRDLRDGDWGKAFVSDTRQWHIRGKELLKKLAQQKRLAAAAPVLPQSPSCDADWCDEALASHGTRQVAGIIATDPIAAPHAKTAVVSSISKLTNAAWWIARSSSLRLARTFADYDSALDLVLRHANSLMLVDPYLDPSDVHQYEDVVRLLEKLRHRTAKPLIELHRAAWYGAGNDKRARVQEVVDALTPRLSAAAKVAEVGFDVFLWDDIHDRYLVSDVIGISLPYGFATTAAPNAMTTWTRLGRGDRDAVQRDFDPSYRAPRHRFRI